MIKNKRILHINNTLYKMIKEKDPDLLSENFLMEFQDKMKPENDSILYKTKLEINDVIKSINSLAEKYESIENYKKIYTSIKNELSDIQKSEKASTNELNEYLLSSVKNLYGENVINSIINDNSKNIFLEKVKKFYNYLSGYKDMQSDKADFSNFITSTQKELKELIIDFQKNLNNIQNIPTITSKELAKLVVNLQVNITAESLLIKYYNILETLENNISNARMTKNLNQYEIYSDNIDLYTNWNEDLSKWFDANEVKKKQFLNALPDVLAEIGLINGIDYLHTNALSTSKDFKKDIQDIFMIHFKSVVERAKDINVVKKYQYWIFLLNIFMNNNEVSIETFDDGGGKINNQMIKNIVKQGTTTLERMYDFGHFYWVKDLQVSHTIQRAIQQDPNLNKHEFTTEPKGRPSVLGVEQYYSLVFFQARPILIIKYVPFFGRLRAFFKGDLSKMMRMVKRLK